MLYSDPAEVLDNLSNTVSRALTAEIDEDPDNAKYETALLADTMRFLTKQSRNRDRAIVTKRQATLATIEELEELTDLTAAQDVLNNERHRLEELKPTLGNQNDIENAVVRTNIELLNAVNEGHFGENTDPARELVYQLFEARVECELEVLR